MHRVLVTGGAGYIGSVLVPSLLDLGYSVTVIDNHMYKQTSLAGLVRKKNLQIIYGDVRDKQLMLDTLRKADTVIPLAAIVGAPACSQDPTKATEVNRESVLWLLGQLSLNQQIIMPTTNSAYGSGDENNYCDESTPLRPLSLYAKDKVEVENRLMENDLATSFRLATVFGISPRMRLDLLVNHFVYKACIDSYMVIFEGHFRRNYIHVEDVVQAFVMAIETPEIFKGQVFNVGLSTANISKLELCKKIESFVPSFVFYEAPFGKDPDQRNYIVSNRKIESLGFKPGKTLEDGITELVSNFKMFDHRSFTNI